MVYAGVFPLLLFLLLCLLSVDCLIIVCRLVYYYVSCYLGCFAVFVWIGYLLFAGDLWFVLGLFGNLGSLLYGLGWCTCLFCLLLMCCLDCINSVGYRRCIICGLFCYFVYFCDFCLLFVVYCCADVSCV